MDRRMIIYCWDCRGKYLKAALIFGTPGKEEEANNFPVPGRIRKNLGAVLEKLKTKNYFNEYESIYDFRITHAFAGTQEHKSRAKKEKAIETEILSENNLDRLYGEISDIKEFIICFGNKAHLAIEEIKHKLDDGIKVVKVSHLSPVSFNNIKGASNFQGKIDIISENLITQLKV